MHGYIEYKQVYIQFVNSDKLVYVNVDPRTGRHLGDPIDLKIPRPVAFFEKQYQKYGEFIHSFFVKGHTYEVIQTHTKVNGRNHELWVVRIPFVPVRDYSIDVMSPEYNHWVTHPETWEYAPDYSMQQTADIAYELGFTDDYLELFLAKHSSSFKKYLKELDESIADESIADESIADESIADESIPDESIAVLDWVKTQDKFTVKDIREAYNLVDPSREIIDIINRLIEKHSLPFVWGRLNVKRNDIWTTSTGWRRTNVRTQR